MRNILTIFCLVLLFNTKGQGFETFIKLDKVSIPDDVTETKDGYVVAVKSYIDNTFNESKSYLLLLNQNGEVTIKRELPNYYRQTISKLYNFGDTVIIAVGYVSTNIDSTYNIIVYRLNANLDILKTTTLKTIAPSQSNTRADLYVNNYNSLIFQFSHIADNRESYGFTICEFDANCNFIKDNFISTKRAYQACITKNKDSQYMIFDDMVIYYLDNNFSLTNQIFFWDINLDNYLIFPNVIWENDTLLTVSIPNIDNKYCTGIGRINMNTKTMVADTIYPYIENPFEIYAYNNSIATNGTYYFLASTTNFPTGGSGTYFDEYITGVRVMKVNNDFSVKWDKHIRNDACNFLYAIKATTDGGCIVIGERYDFSLPEKYYSAYIAKLDSNGNTRPLSKINQTVNNSFTLYPNPGNGHVTVNMPAEFNNAVVTFYNIAGVVQHSQTISNTNPAINVTNLPAGLYIYTIANNGIIAGQGKWVKN